MKDKKTPGIVVVGASAGGVDALQRFVAALPADIDAAVLIVLHLWPETESHMPAILSRAGALPVSHPDDNEPLEAGHVYVAPPDRHLFFHDSMMRVVRGPKENLHRPAIDVLFRSAALEHDSRVIGVLLTGADDDGAAGLKMIRERGGITIVQDPADSAFPEMPQSALHIAKPDYTLPLKMIGPLVCDLVTGKAEPPRDQHMRELKDNSQGSEEGRPIDVSKLGPPSPYSCPDCNGTLWEVQDGELLRYRCRVGHSYSTQSIIEAESEAVERALWEAVRVLEESASMSRRIALKTESLRARLTAKAEEREHHAQVLRELLLSTASDAA